MKIQRVNQIRYRTFALGPQNSIHKIEREPNVFMGKLFETSYWSYLASILLQERICIKHSLLNCLNYDTTVILSSILNTLMSHLGIRPTYQVLMQINTTRKAFDYP